MPLRVEQEGENETGTCACCGQASRAVWGVVSDETRAAAYHVHWTDGHLMDFSSTWTVLIGQWGGDTSAADRSIVSIELRHDEPRGMTVIDPPDETIVRYSSLAANALPREKVIGQPVATDVFDICDAICLQDARIIAAFTNAADNGRSAG
jgi:hypothetical protein